MAGERNTFIENGWRQFCILCPNAHGSLLEHAHIAVEDKDLLLVVTQTCDLVNDISTEPFFEVACLHPLDRAPTNEYLHGRNSRRLELTLEIQGAKQHYYMQAHERFFVRHSILKEKEIVPYDSIQDENTKNLLIKWLIGRYSRPAFPDTFDQRWKRREKQIKKIIKQLELVQDIYIRLDPFNELAEDQAYEITVLLLMDNENFDNPTIYKKYDNLRKKLEDEFVQCSGIKVESVDLESNVVVTIKTLQEYARWDYSYLSYREPVRHDFPCK